MAIKDDYRARAAAARAEAKAATLENVRERCLRSAAAWDEMAASAERTEILRAKREAEIAAKIAADREAQLAAASAD